MSSPVQTSKRVGVVFRKWRNQKGLLQKQVAFDIGMETSIYRYLESRAQNPLFSTVCLICRYFGKTPNDLVRELDE